MIFPNSLAIALVGFVGVNAGPCRPSSSDKSTVITATVTGSIESTVTATTLPIDTTAVSTATAPTSDVSTAFPSSATETSAATQSDAATFTQSYTTTQESTPTTTITTAAMTTSQAPEGPPPQCADLPNPYTADDGIEYDLRCGWAWVSFEDLQYLSGSTMKKCIEACGRRDDCNYAQFDSDTSVCVLIGVGFDDTWNQPGVSNAVKRRPI